MEKSYYSVLLSLALVLASICRAADTEPASTRYFADLLDRRSTYGTFWFPEPLRAPEMDVDSEVRFDFFHGESADAQSNELVAEVEHNIGLLTLEVKIPYVRESRSSLDPATGRITHDVAEGIGNVELAARHPIFQLVSPD